MAKLIGPLLSFGARGAVGKTLVSAEWRGVKYMRQYVIPNNPRTTEQTVTRDTFKMLNGFWLGAPAAARAPWVAAAVGQKFTDRNKLISSNMPALRGEADMQNFIGSPGNLGGPPLESIAPVAGGATGEIDVPAVAGIIPTGWTLTQVHAMAFPDQDPALDFAGPIAVGFDATSAYQVDLTGLPAATLCIVTAWPEWLRPDGKVAYGPSLVDTATSAA